MFAYEIPRSPIPCKMIAQVCPSFTNLSLPDNFSENELLDHIYLPGWKLNGFLNAKFVLNTTTAHPPTNKDNIYYAFIMLFATKT